MIVSYEFDFVFVRCRKTASTSTETYLSRFAGPSDIITSFSERDELLRLAHGGRSPQNTRIDDEAVFFNHMSAAAIARRIDETFWNRAFKFCFERNPWDKAISLYFHRHRATPRCSFDEFLDSGEVNDCRNISLYTQNGRIAVDFIGRYENLMSDLARSCKTVGLPVPVTLPSSKSQFRTDRRPYREFLSETQRKKIDRLFGDEIDLLGHIY